MNLKFITKISNSFDFIKYSQFYNNLTIDYKINFVDVNF